MTSERRVINGEPPGRVWGVQRHGEPEDDGRVFGGFTLCRSEAEARAEARRYASAGWTTVVLSTPTDWGEPDDQ